MSADQASAIQKRIQSAHGISRAAKDELLRLFLAALAEIRLLGKTRFVDARRISTFLHVFTSELIHADQNPLLMMAAARGLTCSVEGFQNSHPALVEFANRLVALPARIDI